MMPNECSNCQKNLMEDAIFCLNCYTPNGWRLDDHRRALITEFAEHPLLIQSRIGSTEAVENLRELLRIAASKRLKDSQQATWLFATVLDYLCGFGPLGIILRDPSASFVLVKDFDQIFVSNSQGKFKTGAKYDSRKDLIAALHQLAKLNNQGIGEDEEVCEFIHSFWNFRINFRPKPNDNFLVITTSNEHN